MSELQIDKVLILSTAHVTKEIAEMIDDPKYEDHDWTPNWRRPEGWMFDVHNIDFHRDSMPKVLLDVLLFAQSKGVDWVMFDCDAAIIEELPQHEW